MTLDELAASIKKVAPNVDLPALAFSSLAIVVGIFPMLASLDVIHEPDTAFPSGRIPAFIGGVVFFTGGVYFLIARALATTRFIQEVRKPLVSLLAGILMLSFGAIPASMLVLGTPGTIRVTGPLVSFAFHSVIADKIVLSTLTVICGVLSVACFVDYFRAFRDKSNS